MYILGHTICSKSTYYIVDTFKSKLELIYAIYAGNDRKKGCIFTSGFSMLLFLYIYAKSIHIGKPYM